MTLIVGVSTNPGTAISTDSRLRCTFLVERDGEKLVPVDPQGPEAVDKERIQLTVSDTARKLFVVRDRFIVAVGGDLTGTDGFAVIEAFTASPTSNVATTTAFVDALLTALRAVPQVGIGEAALIAGVDDTSGVATYAVQVRSGNVQRIDPRQSGIIALGYKAVAHRLLAESHIPFAAMDLQNAVDLSRFVVDATIRLQEFEVCERAVGGAVVTAVVDHHGARFVAPPAEVVAHQVGAPPALLSQRAA